MKETMNYNAGLFQLRPYMMTRIHEIMMLNQTIDECDVLFLGDSITEAFDVHDAFDHLGTIINAGVSGLTSDVLCYLIDECALKFNPKHIFIMIGTNDLGQTCMTSPKQVALNIKKICDHLHKNIDTHITVIAPLPCDETKHGMHVGKGIRSNETLRMIFNETKYLLTNEVDYVDCFDMFLENNKVRDDLFIDGLHLSPAGYALYKEAISAYLE